MSDRDYIIQEIRKLFKENQNPVNTAVKLYNTDEKFRKAIDAAAAKKVGALKVLQDAGLAGKMKKDEEAYATAYNIKNQPGIKTQAQTDISKKVTPAPDGAQQTTAQQAQSKDSKAKVQPTQGKTTPAKDAKPTEDFPFEVVQVGDNFPATIVPGMDRRDKGFGKKGASKSINSAAIKILGPDPRKIYTALINSGVVQSNYSPKADFSDLRKLIARFQELAIYGLLRYQKKMKISGADAEKALTYKPTVKTQDLRTKQDPELRDKLLADRPAVTTEQKAANVAVDGKIGSRTAKLLKIYAEKSSFEKLKKRAGVVPSPGPSPAPTPAPSKQGQKKPEPKAKEKKNECAIGFINEDDIRVKTVLTILGYGSCQLEDMSRNNPQRKNDFSKLLDIFQTVDGGRGSTAFEERYIKKKEKYTKAATSPAGQNDVISKITLPAMKALEDEGMARPQAPVKRYKYLRAVYDVAISSKIFDFYSGFFFDPKNPINFAFVNVAEGESVPLVYPSDSSSLGGFESFLKTLRYHEFVSMPPEKRKQTIEKPMDLSRLKRNCLKHLSKINFFLKEGVAMAEDDPSFKGSKVLGYAKTILYSYSRALKVFLRTLVDFEKSPDEENLNRLVAFGSPISLAQKKLHKV